MSAITGQVSWVYCNKLTDAVAFYRDMLGLPVSRDAGSAMIFATATGAFLGLCETFEGRTVSPAGSMITLLVEDKAEVDRWYDRLAERGVPTQGAPKLMQRFGIYSFLNPSITLLDSLLRILYTSNFDVWSF